MSKRIYRHTVNIIGVAERLPEGQIVHVAADRSGNLTALEVWILQDPNEARLQEVVVIGTGMNVPDGAEHIMTALAGPLVWHLFRVTDD